MAHQYPTGSTYGTPYTGAQPFYSPFQQTPVQQPLHPSSSLQTNNGYQPQNATNVAGFDTNTQFHTTVASVPFPASSYPPDAFKQFATSSNVPPTQSTFSPAPVSNLNYSQFAHPRSEVIPHPAYLHNNLAFNVNSAQELGSLFNPRQGFSAPNGGQNMYAHQPHYNLAEGAVSGNAVNANTIPQSINRSEPSSQNILAGQIPKSSSEFEQDQFGQSIKTLPRATEAPQFSHQQHAIPFQEHQFVLPESSEDGIGRFVRDGSGSSYKPASASPTPPPFTNISTISGELIAPRPPAPLEDSYANKSIAELRQLAKGALLSLAPHNIRFPQLSAEGINANILQQLCKELGLPFELSEESKASEQVKTGLDSANVDSVNRSKPSPSTVNNTSTQQPTVSITSPHLADQLAEAQSEKIGGLSTHISSNTALERKDRIAQLLAAKAARPAAGNNLSSSVSPSVSANKVVASALPVHKEVSELQGTEDAKSHSESANSGENSDLSKREATRQLIRQKIGQLRRENSARALVESSAGQLGNLTNMEVQQTGLDSSRPHGEQSVSLNLSSLPTPIREEVEQKGFSSIIPGLFMTSNDTVQTVQSRQPGQVSTSNITVIRHENSLTPMSLTRSPASNLSQKRPIAADSFEDDLEPQTKRQNVSANDDVDTMDTNVPTEEEASEGEIIEDDESEFVPQAMYLQNARKDHSYKSRQTHVDDMRKKVAETESRKQLKNNQTHQDSPQNSEVNIPSSKPSGLVLPPTMENASSRPSSTELQTKPITSRIMSKLTPTQLAERAAALKADLLKRLQRQTVLQDGLPNLDAEVHRTQNRLKEVRNQLIQARLEAEKHEAEASRMRVKEREILAESIQLERQLQEGLSGQMQYSDELRELNQETKSLPDNPPNPFGSALPQISSYPTTKATQPSPEELQSGQRLVSQHESVLPEGDLENDQNNGSVDEDMRQTSGDSFAESPQHEIEAHQSHDQSAQDTTHSGSDMSQTYDDPREGQFHATTESEWGASVESRPTSLPQPVSEDESMEVDDESDGSASMSDSGSDEEEGDYEPHDGPLPETVHLDEGDDSDEYDPEEAPVEDPATRSITHDGNDNDDAELNDYAPEGSEGMIESSDSLSPEQGEINMIESSTATGSFEQSQESSRAEESNQAAVGMVTPHFAIDKLSNQDEHEEVNTGQPLTQDQEGTDAESVIVSPSADEENDVRSQFVPYETPLKPFKSFRFHPQFNDVVKNGYRSLTYSNSIDWKRPICPAELAGETCTDPSCEEQHFQQLGLAGKIYLIQSFDALLCVSADHNLELDDKILVQMSSANDILDKDERDRYLSGLKQVIADLRQKGVKDFESVANALSSYRRQYFTEQES